MYQPDTSRWPVRRSRERTLAPRSGRPEHEEVRRWPSGPTSSSSPSSACCTSRRCTATSCASGSTPRSARSARSPTARSTPASRRWLPAAWSSRRCEEPAPTTGKRSRIVYQLTADGKEHFAELLAETGPLGVGGRGLRGALRLLRAHRRSHPAADPRGPSQRASRSAWTGFGRALARTRERVDSYTLELQRHGLESVEREVRWLNELIETSGAAARPTSPGAGTPDGRPTASGPANPADPGHDVKTHRRRSTAWVRFA